MTTAPGCGLGHLRAMALIKTEWTKYQISAHKNLCHTTFQEFNRQLVHCDENQLQFAQKEVESSSA